MTKKNKYYREALEKLKEERGPVSDEFRERNKCRTKLVRAVSKLMHSENLKTVPAVQEKLPEYTTEEVFGAIMYLMKFSGLTMINKRGEYPEFSFNGGH